MATTETQTASVVVQDATPTITHKEPLKLKGVLDQFESFDVTPVIGREFANVDLKEWLEAPNSDDLIRDLAITSKCFQSKRHNAPSNSRKSRREVLSFSGSRIIWTTNCRSNLLRDWVSFLESQSHLSFTSIPLAIRVADLAERMIKSRLSAVSKRKSSMRTDSRLSNKAAKRVRR